MLGLLMLFGAGNSHAMSSFRNTPLYKHIIRGRSTGPARLYEKELTIPDKQDEVAGKSGDEKIEISEKDRDTKATKGVDFEKPWRGFVANTRGLAPGRSAGSLTDPSVFERDMPFSEAIDILRNSTFPKLNIAVLWKDLEENADIYPDTPIGIDGVTGVSLSRHLKSLLDGVSGGSQERLGYVVDDGVVVISTLGSLPARMVTRVYDITDLVGQPANYGFQGFGFGMGGMGMQGGLGMPYGGGLGMQGGMMPGLGGGYGNFGGGYGTSPSLTGTPYRPFR